jgi:hypothetical protein
MVFCVVVVAALSSLLVGCAWYGNMRQYESGDWWGIAGSREAAQIRSDQLAHEKQKAQGAGGGAIQGFPGIVMNTRDYFINFLIRGPEKRGYLLKPKETVTDNLVVGTYSAEIQDMDGRRIGEARIFHVNTQKHFVFGEKYNWYVVY